MLHEYHILLNSEHGSHFLSLLHDGKLHPVSQEIASVTCLKLVLIRFGLWL